MKSIKNFQQKKISDNTKRMLLIAFLIVIIIVLCIMIYFNFIYRNDNGAVIKSSEDVLKNMTEEEKKILNIEETKEEKEKQEIQKKVEEKTTTDEFKKFDELTEEEKKGIDVIPRKEEVPIDELDDITDDTDDNIIIPAKYDLRDTISIKVDDQKSYGLCWAFASFNALETHLALKENKSYDFSEIHLDYIESELLYGTRSIHNGGNWEIFRNYFSVSGPVLEDVSTYDDQPEDVYKKFPDMDSDIVITKAVSFPSIRKGENGTSEEDTKKIRDAIKRHIMKNGGVFASIYTNGSDNQFNTRGYWGNHAITIIGWDDNYSKDNFIDLSFEEKDIVPEHDGAYIAVNSWGENWGDKGYFYISYEDKIVETDVNGIVSTSMEDAYKISDIKSNAIRQYIKDNYKFDFISYNGEDYITDFALSKISSLDLSNMNLNNDDLADISLFSKISSLYLSGNLITDISKLPDMTRLSYIDLSNNKITNLSSLSKYHELVAINLSNNSISDISPLKDMKNLKEIDLTNNKISDISELSNISNLNFVTLDNNNIKDVSSISNMKLLKLSLNGNSGVTGYEKVSATNLYLSNCNIKELSNLSNNKNLTLLDISNNPNIIIKKDFLPNTIYSLNISGNNLFNLEFLQGMNKISSLDISSNNITILPDLQDEESNEDESMEFLSINISNNPIKDISTLNKYKSVIVDFSNSTNIDLSIFKDIENIVSLDLSNDSIKDFSNFSIEKLESLDLSKNKGISNLNNISNIKGLTSLSLNECGITDLNDISKLNDLENLSLDSNDIKDVSLFNKMNKLSTLSLSKNYNLTGELTSDSLRSLNINDTNITSLNIVKNLKNLNYVSFNNNKISDLDKAKDYFNSENNWIYISLSDEDIEYDVDIEDVYNLLDNPRISLNGIDYVNIKLNGKSFKEYINQKWNLKKKIMRYVGSNYDLKIQNGVIDKKINHITYDDDSKPFVLGNNSPWIMGYKVYK